MSFLTKQFDSLGFGDSKRDEPQQGPHDYGFHGPGQAGPPPAQYYAAPPQPAYQPPSDKPPLPPGWTPLFDQELQRWYYAQDATGRTQWEAPGFESVDTRLPGDGAHGVYAPGEGYDGQGSHHDAPPAYGAQAYQEHEGREGKGGGALLGAAGGLAAGAASGAVLHHVMSGSSSDDINAHFRPEPAGAYGAPLSPAKADVDGSSVSSSDRDEVEEARQRYHEALAAADDSDAGSSEEEALEEAREEYYQECEDTYGGDDDDDEDEDDYDDD